ncbi:MAG: DNA polymerase III subunit gamma/tau [Candidatus Omnitrophica bacterium]|nr:DNA polymerase III subunit gamma/tau [Candidatus Omnitrophota bacterium]
MSYLVISRKWRPKNFQEIIGQEHVTAVLQNAIKLNRVAHSYLFSGPRGVGKTTTARVLAKALNCAKGPSPEPCLGCVECDEIAKGSSMDVLEIDGASNRGIEQIRDLRENVKLKPSRAKFKIYIIDEVHMLTEAAFNALLKTLEEPPEHVIFIFATTQPNKIPITILSRCQRFDFKPFALDKIKDKLIQIIKDEKISFEQEAIIAIAEHAEGSLRDAESLLDQLICVNKDKKIDLDLVNDFLGRIESGVIYALVQSLINSDSKTVFITLDSLISEGKELPCILESVIEYFRAILHTKIVASIELILRTSSLDIEKIKKQAEQLSKEELIFILDLLGELQSRMRYACSVRVLIETGFLKICSRSKYQIAAQDTGESAPDLKNRNNFEENPGGYIKKKIKTTAHSQQVIQDTNLSPGIDFQTLGLLWPEILSSLRDSKAVLSSYLAGSCVKSAQGNTVTVHVAVGSDFQRELIDEPGNRKTIEDAISGKLGQRVRLQYIYDKTVAVDKKIKMDDILNNPKLRKISTMFNAKVLKVIPKNNEI